MSSDRQKGGDPAADIITKFSPRLKTGPMNVGTAKAEVGVREEFVINEYESKTAKELRDSLAEVLYKARYAKQRTIITQHGKISAVLVPFEDLAKLRMLEKRLAPEQRHQQEVVVGSIDDLRAAVDGSGENDEQRRQTEQTVSNAGMASSRADPPS